MRANSKIEQAELETWYVMPNGDIAAMHKSLFYTVRSPDGKQNETNRYSLYGRIRRAKRQDQATWKAAWLKDQVRNPQPRRVTKAATRRTSPGVFQ